MRRGDIVSIAAKGDFSSKPRPSIVVQSDLFNEYHPAITVCPITSNLTGDVFFRIPIANTVDTGLVDDSEIEIDRVQAVWRSRIGSQIGRAPDDVMIAVDEALHRWLDL